MTTDPPFDLSVRQQRLFDKCMAVEPGNDESAWRAIAAGAKASDADLGVVLKALRIVAPNGRRRS